MILLKAVIEEDNVLVMPSLATARHFCFAAYYVCNTTYPPKYRHLLLFLEKFVYNLKPSAKMPLCILNLHDNLIRIAEK